MKTLLGKFNNWLFTKPHGLLAWVAIGAAMANHDDSTGVARLLGSAIIIWAVWRILGVYDALETRVKKAQEAFIDAEKRRIDAAIMTDAMANFIVVDGSEHGDTVPPSVAFQSKHGANAFHAFEDGPVLAIDGGSILSGPDLTERVSRDGGIFEGSMVAARLPGHRAAIFRFIQLRHLHDFLDEVVDVVQDLGEARTVNDARRDLNEFRDTYNVTDTEMQRLMCAIYPMSGHILYEVWQGTLTVTPRGRTIATTSGNPRNVDKSESATPVEPVARGRKLGPID